MNKTYFATNNQGKLKEASEMLGISVLSAGLEIDEVQSLDPHEVALKKAQAYYEKLNKPILVEDTSLIFKSLGRLPGTYINDFSKELKNTGLINLLSQSSNREAEAQVTLIFIDASGTCHEFVGKIAGSIAKEELGENGFGWDPIFIPVGQSKTFAQMTNEEKNRYSMRGIAFAKFKEWIQQNTI